jgi:riboflavin synthase
VFSGIVEERGRVRSLGPDPAGPRLEVESRTAAADAAVGASVAVDGVCLTVVALDDDVMAFDLTGETLARTSLGRLRPGDGVNLERPVTLATRLSGHLVQGHVDGVGEVTEVVPEGEGVRMTIRPPDGLGRWLVEKGSVAVDGVSLTVAALRDDSFEVALVPHTLEVTTLGDRRRGDPVNLEMDVLAKYVDAMARRDR